MTQLPYYQLKSDYENYIQNIVKSMQGNPFIIRMSDVCLNFYINPHFPGGQNQYKEHMALVKHIKTLIKRDINRLLGIKLKDITIRNIEDSCQIKIVDDNGQYSKSTPCVDRFEIFINTDLNISKRVSETDTSNACDTASNSIDNNKKIVTSTVNYIYLLKEREFIKTNEDVYKIGRSKQENIKRFNQYPKGSILLLQIVCEDCISEENTLIKLFKTKFKQREDIGIEYFEGNYMSMIGTILSVVNKPPMVYDTIASNTSNDIDDLT